MKAFRVQVEKKYRTSLRIPETLLEKIHTSMSKNGYGIRSRSKWICESVEELVKQANYCELIAEEFMDKGENQVIPLTMDNKIISILEKTGERYKLEIECKEIDQSVILRTAIIQKLIKEGGGIAT